MLDVAVTDRRTNVLKKIKPDILHNYNINTDNLNPDINNLGRPIFLATPENAETPNYGTISLRTDIIYSEHQQLVVTGCSSCTNN